jgi:hypothetical protein
MNRIVLTTTAFLALSAGIALAGVAPPVPWIPSEVAKRLVPTPSDMPPGEEDAAKIADRILQNTKEAADRLKESDPGTDTRKKQDQTLRDIDALLKQAENPSPMGSSGEKSDEQKNQDMGGGSQGGASQPMGGSSGQKGMSKQSGGGKSGQKQAGSSGSKSQSWRERRQQEQRAKADQERGSGEPKNLPDPTGSGQRADTQAGSGGKKEQPGGAGATAGGNDRAGQNRKLPPSLPVDDQIAKQVWGHLPEKLRQQMSQYYKEQFMPRYDDLLRQYYASLAEREKAPKK